MQDKEQKGWYKVTVALHDGLFQEITKDMSNGGQIRPQNMILIKQTFLLIQLYKDCIFVGFAYEDKEAEKVISNLMSKVSSESSLLIEIPDNPFYNLYFGLCCLERVLELIKEEYTTNINASIKHLEDLIYESNDFQNLIEVSRNIGRKLINQDLHSNFSILKNHITEQLEYLKQSKKQTLIEITPPQTAQVKEGKIKEIAGFENMESFVEWLCRNPYLAEKEYPEITQGLKNRLKLSPPHETALIIQKIPEQFNLWRNEVNELYGITKKKKITQYIELLNLVLDSEYSTIVENEAVEHIRDEILEQLQYWKLEYNKFDTSATEEEGKKDKIKPKCRSYSLLYFILIEKKIETSFDLRPEGKIKSIKTLTDKLGIDATQFRKELDSFHKPNTRINIRNEKNYRQAIQMLNEDPIRNKEAIAMAISELKIFAPIG